MRWVVIPTRSRRYALLRSKGQRAGICRPEEQLKDGEDKLRRHGREGSTRVPCVLSARAAMGPWVHGSMGPWVPCVLSARAAMVRAAMGPWLHQGCNGPNPDQR